MSSGSYRTSILIAALMCAAVVLSLIAKPHVKAADLSPPISLEVMVPKQFGDWSELTTGHLQVVNPQAQNLLDRLYRQLLTRTYADGDGYRIMLSLGYGSDLRDRGSLQAHKPEVCYPAQGFVVEMNEPGTLLTPSGNIPVRRLFATMGSRREPVTYWLVVGDSAVTGKLHKRLLDLRYGLSGRIPDGMLFRVSSIDSDQDRAYRLQDKFIVQLLGALSETDRRRISGLGGAWASPRLPPS